MESFATLIKNRRSTRKFTDQLLSPEQVEMILKAALMAPASKRKNPWQFVVVEDKEMLKKLAGCKPAGASFLEGCALAVVVMANVMDSDVWVEDASIASPMCMSVACWIFLISWRCSRLSVLVIRTRSANHLMKLICNGKRFTWALIKCRKKTRKHENSFYRSRKSGDTFVARYATGWYADWSGVQPYRGECPSVGNTTGVSVDE